MSIEQFDIKHELGRGTFGVTYLGYDKVRGIDVAVKTIDINKSFSSGADIDAIHEEIETLKDLSAQPQCYKYVACYIDSFEGIFNGVPTIFIISEYINGSSLTSYIKNNNGTIQPSVLWPLYLQSLLGLKFIHDRNYAHRDIKPDNLMITKDETIKYIDFGLACLEKCKKNSCSNTCKSGAGTLLWFPPEFYNGQHENSLAASLAHDIWSLGVVFYEMASGHDHFPFKFPKDATTQEEYKRKVEDNIAQSPQQSTNYKHDDGRTKLFLDSMLINNWKSRPSIDECIFLISDYILSQTFRPEKRMPTKTINAVSSPYKSTPPNSTPANMIQLNSSMNTIPLLSSSSDNQLPLLDSSAYYTSEQSSSGGYYHGIKSNRHEPIISRKYETNTSRPSYRSPTSPNSSFY